MKKATAATAMPEKTRILPHFFPMCSSHSIFFYYGYFLSSLDFKMSFFGTDFEPNCKD